MDVMNFTIPCTNCGAPPASSHEPRWKPGDLVRCGERVCEVARVTGHDYFLKDDGRVDGWAEDELHEPGTGCIACLRSTVIAGQKTWR